MSWFTRNDHGFWCNFCGELLKPAELTDPNHWERDEEEWGKYETELENGSCRNCGAPDEFDPEAI